MKELEAYLAALKDQGAVVAGLVNDGASDEEVAKLEQVPGCTFPADVVAMFRVMNGLARTEDTTYDQLWVDGTFAWFSIDEAIADYQTTEELRANDKPEGFDVYWPTGFFPIGTPGDGSRLLVNCRNGSPTYGAVYELFHGDGLSRHANSLTAYVQTVATALAQRVITVDDDGCLEPDEDAYNRTGRQLNPGCDATDDSLPSASVAKDWL
ncbi:MAG: SMI1/KNR4 family protein [Deltaproteobacteria bacterium]|nr:SMI1/KNR4 family protein [Deltaproteobacteria bacterium]